MAKPNTKKEVIDAVYAMHVKLIPDAKKHDIEKAFADSTEDEAIEYYYKVYLADPHIQAVDNLIHSFN